MNHNPFQTVQGARLAVNTYLETANALFSLSQTQRRLAHRQRSEALRWEAEGHHRNYAACILEARRLWRDAKWHLQRARMNQRKG